MNLYAGIGSRETPSDVLQFMTVTATFLCANGYVLRSGGAPGADLAFEAGVPDPKMKEIYLPWKKFNGNPSPLYEVTCDAIDLAKQYHPSWSRLTKAGRQLMARNSYQIMGYDLETPVAFVICWTRLGKKLGGTAQALRIAEACAIPIYNLYFEETRNTIQNWMNTGGINAFREE